MSATDTSSDTSSPTPNPRTGEWRLEVVGLPVSDVDRAKNFYVNTLGWRLDADFNVNKDFWVVQVTPPGSLCSVHFGKGITSAAPGSVDHMYLVVSDLEAARAELVGRGVDVSEIFHLLPGEAPQPGPNPDGLTYTQYVSFNDPDGNRWLVQEITTAPSGPMSMGERQDVDVATLAELLRETEQHHGTFEASTPKHDWSDWYAPYLHARLDGKTSDEATEAADQYMKDVHNIVRG